MTVICTFDASISSDGYRSAISSQNLQPGSIISSEKPFATMLLRPHSHQYCAHCLAKFDQDKPGKRCLGGCQYTFFCGRECQKDHFSIHKHTCKKYLRIMGGALQQYNSHFGMSGDEEGFPLENFMLGRNVYIRLCNLAGISVKDKRTDLPLPSDIEALCEGPNTPTQDSIYEKILSTIIANSFGIDHQDAINFFNRLLKKFRYNNFGIQNSLQTVIASGVFPKGAILNHSCDPNCILTYEGSLTMQVIRTIKPVSEGDELFHSYTDICQPTSVRQSRLMETYSIRCDCERCEGQGRWGGVDNALIEGNTSLSEDDAQRISTLTLTAQQISIGNVDDGIDNLRREYDALREAVSIQKEKLGRYNLERYKTECLALNVAMLMGGAEVVLPHAEATVDFLTFVCNEYHPLLLLQKMTLSELYDAYGKKGKARDMYKQLVNACKIAYGEEHEFVHHYKVLLSSNAL